MKCKHSGNIREVNFAFVMH